jgi:hypothetical protein
MRYSLFTLLVCLTAGTASTQEKATKPKTENPTSDNADAITKKFYRSWLEVEREAAGKSTKDPFKLYGVKYAENDYSVWLRRGELSTANDTVPGVRFDPTSNPMRVDILGGVRDVPPGKRQSIQLGICKFEKENLVIVLAPWQMLAPPEKGKDYAERPTEFKTTKENKWTLSIMKPSEFFAQD